MSDFRKFILGLAATFGLPWLCLIIIPLIQYQQLAPRLYNKDKDGIDGLYPPAPIHRQGQLVYAQEGCVQCHTQMIRPTQLGLDGWKRGWGENQDSRPAEPTRSNTLYDYLGEPYAFLGIQRNGPDLANYGWRAPDRNALHLKLYDPRALRTWSNMPAFRHLYTVRKAQGPRHLDAIQFPATYTGVQEGYEVVPSAQAQALVDYLLSLKKAYPLPSSADDAATAPVAAAAPAAK